MRKRNITIIFMIAIMTSSAITLPDFVMQSDQSLEITSPVQGDILTGEVNIVGTSAIKGFSRSELAFSNAVGSQETWFPISRSLNSVEADLLMVWDTTLITDGDYRLRLRVFSEDNSINEFVISYITIRNYTPFIEPTSLATSVLVKPISTSFFQTETPVLRPTRMPENPLAISYSNLAMSLFYGILSIFGLIVISSIYSHWQRK